AQREAEDVQISGMDGVIKRLADHMGEPGIGDRLECHAAIEGAIRQLGARLRPHGQGLEQGAGVDRQHRIRHHAPTMFCPHTRRVWPWMPRAPLDARKLMASATSIGWPPCCRLDSRLATCRVRVGIFAVISVSMNPGATALIDPPREAKSCAEAAVSPMTPAFEVA